MIQAYLDSIKEDSARILREYTNTKLYYSLTGNIGFQKAYNDAMRCVYLAGVIDSIYLIGTTPYIGDSEIEESYITDTVGKIWHYSGMSETIDLTPFSTVVPDDGGSGSEEGDDDTPQSQDHYRSGSLPVVIGANPVTFIKNGIPSPLASSDYTVEAWVIASTGQRQSNLVITGQVAGGFIASDVLKAGTLYYIATLNT